MSVYHNPITLIAVSKSLRNFFSAGFPPKVVYYVMLLAVRYQVIVQLESLESTEEGRVSLSYRLEQLLCFCRAPQTSRVYNNSRTLKNKQLLNSVQCPALYPPRVMAIKSSQIVYGKDYSNCAHSRKIFYRRKGRKV